MRKSPSPRRHLTTPEPDDRTVAPASFYASNKDTTAGSSHTKYHPPASDYRPAKASPLKTIRPSDENISELINSDSFPDANDSVWADYMTNDTKAVAPNISFPLPSTIPINGRDEREERDWWDPVLGEGPQRPGPGFLHSGFERALNDMYGDHLYGVELDDQCIQELSSRAPTDDVQSTTSPTVPPCADFSPPSLEEVITAKPHPEALYSPRTNSWAFVQIGEGILPSTNHDPVRHSPLPNERGRVSSGNCLQLSENLTHHLHLYPSLATGGSLNPSFEMNPMIHQPEDCNGLDVYACCQCPAYIVVSRPIPGVLPFELLRNVYKDKLENPALGMTGHQTAIRAFDVLLRAVENSIWKGEKRSLSMTGKAFQKLGSSSAVQQIFLRLKYCIDGPEKGQISPPDLYGASQSSRQNRAWLLRAWLEISCFYTHMRSLSNSFDSLNTVVKPVATRLLNAYEPIKVLLGLQTSSAIPSFASERADVTPWKELGLYPEHFTTDLLEFAYRAQCRCNPAGTPKYLQSVITIKLNIPPTLAPQNLALECLIAVECSRGRWSVTQIETSAELLGFGKDHDLKLEWGDEIDDEFLISAWKDSMRRAWDDPTNSKQRRNDLTVAAAVLGEQRGSRKVIEELRAFKPNMDPDQAYRVLEVPKDVDEGMLLMVYQLRVEEHPQQMERMKQALLTISESRNSSRLHHYLEKGVDVGDRIGTPHPVDWPRGLNQLGNTCYLNSLLQYFYTIADLREAIKELSSTPAQKLSSDALAQIRVGGRLISHREIDRSRRFTLQLAGLFKDLETSTDSAVTPSLELAKLALVTSKDEDEDIETGKTGTDSSNSTDATLVEEPAASRVADELSHDTKSVLGKRDRGDKWKSSPVEPSFGTSLPQTIDQPLTPPPLPPRKKPASSDSIMMFGRQHDVAECMDNCLFQIEAALLKAEKGCIDTEPRVVKSLFYGKSRQCVLSLEEDPKRSSSCHVKEDVFSHLSINVSDGKLDLYDGLSEYLSDTVEYQGKQAKMDVEILELPPILQIQLQRVKFDRKTGQAFKSQSYIKFEESLVMDRFMEDADPTKKALSQNLWSDIRKCRERVQVLETGDHAPFTSHLDTTMSFLNRIVSKYPEEDTISFLSEEKEKLRATIQSLGEHITRGRSKVEELWSNDSRMVFELSSVFIHRGSSPSWGHYFFYTRHLPDKPESWFKMNDSQVTAVSKEEVLADSTNSTANAYLLVYARKGSGVINTVNRDGSKIGTV